MRSDNDVCYNPEETTEVTLSLEPQDHSQVGRHWPGGKQEVTKFKTGLGHSEKLSFKIRE